MAPGSRPPLSLLVKDLGGLGLYYPGQAAVARAPRGWLKPLSRMGGDLVRALARDGAEMRDELARRAWGYAASMLQRRPASTESEE